MSVFLLLSLMCPAQSGVTDDFRTGAVNLLIATSFAEDGIDLPASTWIVRSVPSI